MRLRIGSFWMIMVPLLPFQAIAAIRKESSDVYLKKVIQELQTFNGPVSLDPNELQADPLALVSFHNNKNQKVLRNQYWKSGLDHHQFDHNQYPGSQIQPISINKIDNDLLELDTSNQHILSRPQANNKSWKEDATGAIGLTNVQLAAMYGTAFQKGAPVGLVPLTTALLSGKTPRVTSTHLEIPSSQYQYSYYFVPLKSFGTELINNHGYKTIPDSIIEDPEVMESQKQMTNPLFAAVSSFIGMALLFMAGVLIFPKLGGFVPRDQQDDFLHLVQTVTEAIDKKSPLTGRSRKSFTNWSFRKRNISEI
ncbi:uncharacterized protein LOC117173326 [Belonocnema kinseyi]|uniref:uncharacterized protein LOC117173326 n=1 Tax=Belonocnema kinseyi TaxID=2817044 RepID=UPI00143D3764|nr:uncharacterized protein LOC117173326 [Belonocnema kinseyi]